MENLTENTQNQLAEIIKVSNLDQSKGEFLMQNFSHYFEITKDWEEKAKQIVVTDATQLTEMKQAREGRLFLREKRIAIEKARKELKEESLREGRAIDSIAKMLTNLIEPIETYLENQENFAKIQEQKRKAELKLKRESILKDYTNITSVYDLENMNEETFTLILESLKREQEKREQEAIRAEEERKERERQEAEEKERIRVENEKLKKEAQEREIKAKEEREKAEKERKILEMTAQKERLEREKAEKELKAQREKAEKERQELERKRLEEQKEKEKAEKQARLASDKDKLILLSEKINSIQLPELKNPEAQKTLDDVKILLDKVESFILERVKNL